MAGYSLPKFTKKDANEIDFWWREFVQEDISPLYCMLLATDADESAASLFENHSEELAEIAGDKCCLIYFRDLEKAKLLEPFHFTEHANKVMQLIKIINVPPNRLPCILFFENMSSGKFVYVEIKNKTISELMETWREVFAFIYSKSKVSLSTVRAYDRSKKIGLKKRALSKNISTFSTTMLNELIKSLVSSIYPKG
jgi:hypothetical protein